MEKIIYKDMIKSTYDIVAHIIRSTHYYVHEIDKTDMTITHDMSDNIRIILTNNLISEDNYIDYEEEESKWNIIQSK